jgi:hypothetical protein
MSDHYLLKMELINELRQAYQLIEANREAGEILVSSLNSVNQYCRANNIPLPNHEKILAQMNKIQALLAPSDGSYHDKQSDAKLPEPPLPLHSHLNSSTATKKI